MISLPIKCFLEKNCPPTSSESNYLGSFLENKRKVLRLAGIYQKCFQKFCQPLPHRQVLGLVGANILNWHF
jgi:hypothetical protein